MIARHRLVLAIRGIAIAISLAVAVSPIATGRAAHCTISACYTDTNHPDWYGGFVVALLAFAVLLRLSPLARGTCMCAVAGIDGSPCWDNPNLELACLPRWGGSSCNPVRLQSGLSTASRLAGRQSSCPGPDPGPARRDARATTVVRLPGRTRGA